MQLAQLAKPTTVARSGMSLRELFQACADEDVPGLPFVDRQGQVVGRVSIRHTLKETLIPDYAVKAAHVLGNDLAHIAFDRTQLDAVLDLPVDPYVLRDNTTIECDSSVVKALAMMERFNTGYLFLVDQGQYRGTVTRMTVARHLLQD